MSAVAIILILLAGIGIGVAVFYFLNRSAGRGTSGNVEENQAFLMLQNQLNDRLNELGRKLDSNIGQSTEVLQRQHSESLRASRELSERLTKLDETNRQVIGFTDQLQKLQDILKNPKQRGIYGEYSLQMLLQNAFNPKQFQMQYQFKDGEIVDAAIFFGDKIVPIDSKFSLENYVKITEESDRQKRDELENLFKQDLKKRIDETAKYIRPEEGTTDFAIMFIPAEGIYYDLLVNKVGAIKVNTRDLIDYAINEKRVHVVSPTTLYVTLQSMWIGMRAYQIQESTKEIIKNIAGLQKHLKSYEDFYNKIGGHLSTTVSAYNSASKEFKKIDKDVLRITGKGIEAEVLVLDKPEEME